jgi:cysteine desulfurase family protein (TIGR01976 family)
MGVPARHRHNRHVTAFPVDTLRAEFPALAVEQDGRPVAYFDGPGGTQVPQRVIDSMADYYATANANDGGAFVTSRRSEERVAGARQAVADLYGAKHPDEIKFGYNMTTLTFHVSRSIGACLQEGDEILVTTLDHEANVAPWQAIGADRGLVIRTVDINPDDCTLDLDDLDRKLSPRTRLVAVGYASNAVGTINPLPAIAERTHAAGAWLYVDAVHYVPHLALDVRAIPADFVVSSPYKWFGPHLGALYIRREIINQLPPYKVRPAHDPFETGTPSFEAIVGTGAAVDYLASVGERFGDSVAMSRRDALLAGLDAIRTYELGLLGRLMDGLSAIPKVKVWGITDTARFAAERAPTVSITIEGVPAPAAAHALGEQGIFTWDGHFYAQALVERLGLADNGGLLRLGIVHYNAADEVDRLLEAIEGLAGS